MIRLPFLLAVPLLCAAVAYPQGRFCIGGDVDRLSASEKTACLAQLGEVRRAAMRTHAPEDWHFVVVCGESGWHDYAAFSQQTASVLEQTAADTDLSARSTFFRGERLKADGAAILSTEMTLIHQGTTTEVALNR